MRFRAFFDRDSLNIYRKENVVENNKRFNLCGMHGFRKFYGQGWKLKST
jgi:hypothetical protein